MNRTTVRMTALAFLAVSALSAGINKAGEAPRETQNIVIDGSTTVGPIAKAFAEYYMRQHREVNITVSESGSGNGAKSLINGACDVADMSRFMKITEFRGAVANGVTPVAHVVAMDGIAIIVHPSNPTQELTIDQVREVYAGKTTNWNQLGGPNKKIVIISRDSNSGTFETFENLVMKGTKIAPGVEYANSNGGVRQRVQSTPGAVGYVGLGFVDRTVKALKINGILPDRRTVTSGQYPIARPLFMFTNGYPELGSHLYSFVTLYLSRKGQEIIEAKKFVPVTSY